MRAPVHLDEAFYLVAIPAMLIAAVSKGAGQDHLSGQQPCGQSARANLILAPVAVAGVFLGVWAHRMVSEKLFFRLTYVLLPMTGAKLISDALA
jgi:uncharacterized membrane protein YfcA